MVQLSSQALEEEQLRSNRLSWPSGVLAVGNCLAADPDDVLGGGALDSVSGEDYSEIYKLLPHLGGLSDSLLRKLPLSAALQESFWETRGFHPLETTIWTQWAVVAA